MPTDPLAELIRANLRAAADPARAPAMQAYMKSTQPYLGVRLPDVRRVVTTSRRTYPPRDVAGLGATAAVLWREATFREENYAAAALCRAPLARGALDLLPLYEQMITTGAWWDHVDAVAHNISDLTRAHPVVMKPLLRRWARDPDRWRRRSAVIAQLDAKADTDLALLTDVIEANAADPEFFVRKAIGWALRQYAWTDPAWVRDFLGSHPGLSPLSRREAAKHLARLLPA